MLTAEQRKKLVEDFMPFAEKQAWIQYRKTPKYVTIDELKSAAYLGLCDAASKAESLVDFNPFIRIYGEMKDYLRSIDWGCRGNSAFAITSEFETNVAPEIVSDNSDEIIATIGKVIGEENTRIFVWHHLDGKKAVEIAQMVGKSKGRISQIMKSSRESLQESPLLRAA